jgi:hypothetical protein
VQSANVWQKWSYWLTVVVRPCSGVTNRSFKAGGGGFHGLGSGGEIPFKSPYQAWFKPHSAETAHLFNTLPTGIVTCVTKTQLCRASTRLFRCSISRANVTHLPSLAASDIPCSSTIPNVGYSSKTHTTSVIFHG